LIDGKKVCGAAIDTARGSEGITMGVTRAMYANGVRYDNPAKACDMKGYVNSNAAVDALAAYKPFYDCCTPPGHSNAYMTEDLDASKSGQVAMQMNFIAFFPGIAKDPNVGGEKPASSSTRRWAAAAPRRAGKASRSSSIPTNRRWRWTT
jgi:multiple sugar transport system substrate-binding protein